MEMVKYSPKWLLQEIKMADSDTHALFTILDYTKHLLHHREMGDSIGLSSDVSVSDLIVERRKWLLDYVWCCTEMDLTDKEVDGLDKRLEDEKSVIEWLHSR